MMMALPTDTRHELSREKLISKVFQTIQTLTYSCCSDELECKRQAKLCLSSESVNVKTKYGITKTVCDGNLVILPKPVITNEGGKNLFAGKIGRLRYFALSVMIATSPLSREVVQLSLAFPEMVENDTPPIEKTCRAPMVFPILSGHILTHVVAAMCASCGQDRAQSDSTKMSPSFLVDTYHERVVTGDSTDSTVISNNTRDCESFIQLGYIAKVLQVLLGLLQQHIQSSPLAWMRWEVQIFCSISNLLEQGNTKLTTFGKSCCQLLRAALPNHSSFGVENNSMYPPEINTDIMFSAFQAAKEAGYKYLCSAGLMLQLLIPSAVSIFEHLDQNSKEEDLYSAMNIDLEEMMGSSLVRQTVSNWYDKARPRMEKSELQKQLNCKYEFRAFDWPQNLLTPIDTKKSLPLLEGSVAMGRAKDDKPRIKALPISYTDLYAELGSLSPNGELTAVCLICGEVSFFIIHQL